MSDGCNICKKFVHYFSLDMFRNTFFEYYQIDTNHTGQHRFYNLILYHDTLNPEIDREIRDVFVEQDS